MRADRSCGVSKATRNQIPSVREESTRGLGVQGAAAREPTNEEERGTDVSVHDRERQPTAKQSGKDARGTRDEKGDVGIDLRRVCRAIDRILKYYLGLYY